ncbi:MAG TPA: hypothetical protein VGE76_03190, partial [Opitutaceae bacterium]
LTGFAGLLAILLGGRAAAERGETFSSEAWRLWGRVGAGVSFGAYLLEYFPGHLGLRLEVNHPVYAAAWWAGGELIATLGEYWFAPGGQRRLSPRVLAACAAGLALAPLTMLRGGSRVFAPLDPFLGALHRDYVQEFLPLWHSLSASNHLGLYQLLLVGQLPLLAAFALLCYLRRASPPVLWFGTSVTLALTLMAWSQGRWLLPATAASLALIVVAFSVGAKTVRPAARWIFAGAILIVFFVPSAVFRYLGSAADIARYRVSPEDARGTLHRDIAAALRRTQPLGDIVLLASPNASTAIGYYGRFQTLGTLYWENVAGLRAAAEIFSADSDDAAARLLRARRVTHVAIVSEENFIAAYHRLLHPNAGGSPVQASFGYRALEARQLPGWLQPIPYAQPESLAKLRIKVRLYRVALD